MDTEKDIKLILERLDRIERLLINLNQKQKNTKTWIKARDVKEKTGWNYEDMRKARVYGWIEWKKDKNKGFLYLLESINPLLIKKHN